jgi:hypothetical protein
MSPCSYDEVNVEFMKKTKKNEKSFEKSLEKSLKEEIVVDSMGNSINLS